MRVGDLIADHQQRILALGGGIFQQRLHRHILPHGSQRNHALMGVGAAHVVQLAPVGLHHHDAGGTGLGGDVAQRLVGLALGQIDLIDGGAGAQRLDHRVAAFNDAIGFRLRQCLFIFVFFHFLFLISFSGCHNSGFYQYSISRQQDKAPFIEILQKKRNSVPCRFSSFVIYFHRTMSFSAF